MIEKILDLLSISLGFSLLFFTIVKVKLNEISKFELLSLSYFCLAFIYLLENIFSNNLLNISAGALESIVFFCYALICKDEAKNSENKKYDYKKYFIIAFVILTIYFIISLIFAFYLNIFSNLTLLKKITEYFLILILFVSLILSKDGSDSSFIYFRLGIIFAILSKLSLNIFKDFHNLFNIIGYISKYIYFIFIYQYLAINMIESPYSRLKNDFFRLKKQSQELEIAKDEAEKVNKAKSAFIANIKQEITTPLNVISGYAFVLYNDEQFSDKKEEIQNILSATQYLSNIFDNILTISQIEIGEFKIQWSIQNLKSLIQTIVELYAAEAREKQLYFKIELDETLDRIMKVPENVLWKIIANLLSNAIKFTKEGFVSFSARLQENLFYINIKDSGNGIDLMSYTDLLDSFNIGEYYLNKTHDGVGLCLSIVNKLVKMLNGHIDVKSKIGEGSEFFIVLDINESKYANSNN